MESKVGAALLPRILAKTVCPVVMVLATPLAEAACRKNDLSFVQLLRPFCTMDHINVPVRTTSDNPYRLQEFHLRCFHASEIQQIPVEAAEAQLLDVVTRARDVALDELKGDPRQIEAVQQMVQAESTSSWFQQYSSAFIQTLVFSEHEAIDHPVACLLVVSSKDENKLGKFDALYNIENWPPSMKDGTMDPRILKHYVVLHDNQDGPPDFAKEIVEELRGALGGNECRLLCINSGPDEESNRQQERKLGCYLGNSDFDEIQDFMMDLCLKQIIPYLEQKVRVLNQQVSATRKGLKNQIKNLWWRKKDTEVPEVPAGYTFSSMESQIRTLADYAFMLRDYDLALSNYRLISSDYKADKAVKRYAGTMEMIGLCLAMLDQSRRETESALETAYVTYLGCGPPTSRFATRVALLWAEVHKSRGQFREAAYVLSRAATDVDEEASLRAAVLLEQSAYCYLRCVPPMLRKYGFHLVLAGARYYVNGQREHANRVYTGALSIYDNQGWIHINDHVSIHLARISSILGQTDVAIQHFVNLFACNQQSPSSQILLLKEFLAAVQSLRSQSNDEVIRVGLPAVSSERVYVRFEDHRTYASASAASLPEDMWRRLEEGLVPSSTASLPTWLDGPKAGQKNAEDFSICFEEEEVAVSIEMVNPLQIPIEVSCMELVCLFESKLSPGGEEGHGSSGLPPLVLSSESFILKGAERKEISLKAKPTREGLLTIVGIKWVFFGVVSSSYDFPVQANAKTKASKMGVPRQRRLKFRVVNRMPRLEVSLHELPSKLNMGELRRVVLEIHNASSSRIKNMKLRTSHPGFLMVGEQGDLDLEFPNCLELPDGAPPGNAHLDPPGSVFCFPQDLVLDVASTLLWPVWFHARQAGELSLNTVLYYESAEEASSRKYRTLRMTHSLQVMPSVEVSVRISPCPGKLDSYLVRMDVANLNSSESFWLRQASCVGDSWYFTAVQPQVLEQSNEEGKAAFLSVSVAPSQLLSPSQSSSFFFHLQEKPAVEEGKRNNVGLWPGSSKERFIDIYSRPLMYFQQQEQQCQTRKDQEVADAFENQLVDLILIFEQHDGMVSDRPPALGSNYHFSSYHLCHCPFEGFLSVGQALRGPRCLGHDFTKRPMCEIPFALALKNCSKAKVMVRVETIDTGSTLGLDESAAPPGWHSVSPPPSLVSLASEASGTPIRSAAAEAAAAVGKVTPCEAYVWCGPKSVTVVEVSAGGFAEVPLRVAVFSPGTYDISSYRVSWSSVTEGSDAAAAGSTRTAVKSSRFTPAPATRSASFSALKTVASAKSLRGNDEVTTTNVLLGHPFLLTVLQLGTSDTDER